MSFLKSLFHSKNYNKINYKFNEDYIEGTLLDLEGTTARKMLDSIEIKQTSLRRSFKDEQCFYEGNCQILKVVEYELRLPEENSLSAMIKMFLWESNNETCSVLRNTETSIFQAILYISNERMVLNCKNKVYSFDLSLDAVVNVTTDIDHIIVETVNNSWVLLTDDSIYIRDLIELMNICYEEQE